MTDLEKEAYKFVLQSLCECPLFMGTYDAKNGSELFMHGIASVMETIACKVSDDTYESFQKLFFENMEKSKKKWLTKE
jgi:hypothetical protein